MSRLQTDGDLSAVRKVEVSESRERGQGGECVRGAGEAWTGLKEEGPTEDEALMKSDKR